MTGIRVLLVGAYPCGGVARGGVEAAVEGLVTAVACHPDVEGVQVISFEDIHAQKVESPFPDVQVVRIPAQRLAMVSRGFLDLSAARRVAEAFRPHIVHGQGVGRAGDVATRLGLPSVVTVHGMAHLEERALVAGRASAAVRIAMMDRLVSGTLARANAVISISKYDRLKLGAPAGTLAYTIPNAVRPEFFSVDTEVSAPVVLSVGGIMRRKNTAGLIRAFVAMADRLPDASLVIAGGSEDSHYRAEVDAAARPLAGRVRFAGALTAEALRKEIATCRCVALFSHQETLPCAIAEAMAAGRPVVSSDVGGIAEMVEDGSTGLLVADGDEESLSEALFAMLSNEGVAREYGYRARAAAIRYHPASVAESTVEVYRSLLGTV